MAQLGRWLGLDGWRLGARDLGERDGSAGPGGAGGGARSPAVRDAAAGRRRRPIPAVRARNRTPFGLGASGGDDELI